jgi:3-hydroxyisobutyrate dehydrogenase-like beta-hydroxyacid dehydrogenase
MQSEAVIGLGIIGEVWANHSAEDGLLKACWNRSLKESAPLFCSSLEEVPHRATLLHIVVADPDAVLSVVERLAPALSPVHVVIQSSTIDAETAEKCLALVKCRGARYVEAPFTGSLPAAQKRELVFYCGGNQEDIAAATPHLERLSKRIFHIGTVTQATTLKLVMNLQIASACEALIEALITSRRAGIADAVFFEAFRLNASFSGVAALKEPKLRQGDFSPQFSIKHMRKDLRLLKKSVPEGALVLLERLVSLYDRAIEAGLGDLDFSSLIQLHQEKQ